jgi:hypothetical protein
MFVLKLLKHPKRLGKLEVQDIRFADPYIFFLAQEITEFLQSTRLFASHQGYLGVGMRRSGQPMI